MFRANSSTSIHYWQLLQFLYFLISEHAFVRSSEVLKIKIQSCFWRKARNWKIVTIVWRSFSEDNGACSLASYHEKGSLEHFLWSICSTDVRLCLTQQGRLDTPYTYKTRNRKKANNCKSIHKSKQFWAHIKWLQLLRELWRSWFLSTDCQETMLDCWMFCPN